MGWEAVVIGSDIGTLKSMLSNAFTKAAEAKDKATGKPGEADARKASAAPPKDTADPAFLLSAGLEDLTKPLRGLADGAGAAAQAGVAQADGALSQLDGLKAYNDAFADQLDQVMSAMGEDLGRMLKAFGLDDDKIDEAVKGFTGKFNEQDRKAAFADMNSGAGQPVAVANAESHERTGVAVEATNIDLVLEQGGKTLSISFDRTTLAMARTTDSAFAVTDGKTAISGAERSATALNAQSEGLTIKADGFSKDELDKIMGALQKSMTSAPDGLTGSATLTPQNAPKDGEPLRLTLDLKGVLSAAFGEQGAKAAASMGKEIQKQGFDVRI